MKHAPVHSYGRAGRPASFLLRSSHAPAVDALFRVPAFDHRDWEARFVAAMREACLHHQAGSPDFRGHLELAGFDPQALRTLDDVERIPWIFVHNFKEAELLSVPREQVRWTLTSSGTTGPKTQTFLDEISENRLRVAAYEIYRGMGVVTEAEPVCNELLFTYDPAAAPNLGTSWTTAMLAEMAPAQEQVFLIHQGAGALRFDPEQAVQTLVRFAASGLPLRMLGFPAFMYHCLLLASERSLPVRLTPETAAASWVLPGGGWKNHRDQAIPKAEFAALCSQVTGIPADHVRDLFGMAEHGIGYTDCEHGRLHIPVYAHAVTRDPHTLERLPPGTPGLLHLFSPLMHSYPSISLLTTDEAQVHPGPCRCGREGAVLDYLGRLGLSLYEGCAIRALRYLDVS